MPGWLASRPRLVCLLAVLLLWGCGREPAAPPPPAAAPPPPAAADTPRADQPTGTVTNSIGMRLVWIPAGEFLMGAAADDPGGREDEKPQHPVRISRPFLMGVFEVTQGEFQQVMGANPSFFANVPDVDCRRSPVDDVTWHAAVDFCRRLSALPAERRAGRVYRLPTEAEWEYACRAGTTGPFHFGDSLSSRQANFNGNYPFGGAPPGPFLNRTTTVGSYAANAFGLHDMHGNVSEWCADKFDRDYYHVSPRADPAGPERGTSPVIRGGDWYSDARDCRSAFRYAEFPEATSYAMGFRVVCRLSPDASTAGALADVEPRRPVEPAAPLARDAQPAPTTGEDWPRWRGPRGDGSWQGPRLTANWPADGLPRAWRQPLGGGYGGVAVAAGRAYVMDRQEDAGLERVLCFDAVDGQPIWSHEFPADYAPVSYGNGPRATPTVDGDRVYALGAAGRLCCLDAGDGKPVWSHDLVADFAARIPTWGLSASPLVFEDLLIVQAGARPEGCYLAFERRSGALRWRSVDDPAGYATPVVIQRDGGAELVVWTADHVRGLDPRSGAVRWTIPFAVNYGTAIADPIFHEGLVLVSSYYDGSKAIRLGSAPPIAEVVWEDRRDLRGLMSQPLYRDGHAFLLDKRHGLTCFVLADGSKLWDDDNRLTPKGRNPQASLVWLGGGDRALALNSDGDLVLARLAPSGYHELARANIIGRTWAHPAYAGNCVYARSDSELVCVVLPLAEG